MVIKLDHLPLRSNPRIGPELVESSRLVNYLELMTDLALVYVSGDQEGLERDKFQFYTSTCFSTRVKYRVWSLEEKGGQPLGQGNHHLHLGHPQASPWEGYVVQRDLGSDRARLAPMGPVLLLGR